MDNGYIAIAAVSFAWRLLPVYAQIQRNDTYGDERKDARKQLQGGVLPDLQYYNKENPARISVPGGGITISRRSLRRR